MPMQKKKAKILSTGAVQKIIREEMPGFRLVELEPESAELQDRIVSKASRSMPSLVQIQRSARAVGEADAVDDAVSEETLWGNSSQFALVEPEGPATSSDTMARRRRTVIVSHGKVITEQG